MSMIKCPECGKDISDRALSCPHCGVPVSNAISNQQNYSNMNYQKESNNFKTKDSMLSIVACVLAGVSMILPLPILLSFFMIISSLIVGLIDLCIKDCGQRHIGSWFAVIISALYLIVAFI